MPRLTTTLSLVNLNLKAASADLQRRLKNVLITASKAWVEEALRAIPVWSGASAYAIKPLADLVDVPVIASPAAHTDRTGRLRPAPDRRSEGFNSASATLDTDGPLFSFRHSTDLFHLIRNEQKNMVPFGFHLRTPGPYFYRRKAKAAFERSFRDQMKRLNFKIAAHVVNSKREV